MRRFESRWLMPICALAAVTACTHNHAVESAQPTPSASAQPATTIVGNAPIAPARFAPPTLSDIANTWKIQKFDCFGSNDCTHPHATVSDIFSISKDGETFNVDLFRRSNGKVFGGKKFRGSVRQNKIMGTIRLEHDGDFFRKKHWLILQVVTSSYTGHKFDLVVKICAPPFDGGKLSDSDDWECESKLHGGAGSGTD